jgi:glycosyltransferase involved in cell wall biosynthesis
MKGKTFFLDQGETLGGAERFLLDFLKNLTPSQLRRLDPVIVGGKLKKYKQTLSSQIPILDFSYPSVRGNLGKKCIRVFQLIQAAKKFSSLARKENAHVFFSNTPRTHFVMWLAKKLFFLKGKWIVMNHDFTVPRMLLRKISSTADILIANGMPSRTFLKKNISLHDQKKIQIIENGIDFSTISDIKPAKEIQRILMLGRIDPRKGQIFAAQAADLLQERNPDLEFIFVGASFSEDERTVYYEKKLHQFVRDRDIRNIKFTGEVSDPFLEIEKSDCLLALPTEPETFGRIVIEALALGKFVLAFDETGPREILKQFENFLNQKKIVQNFSLLVEKQNAMSLAESIGYFADNPEQVSRYTTLAHEYVKKNFNLQETKKRLFHTILD